MVDLDLRKLSAPIEAMRSKVDAAYKLLDAQWKAIADQLSELPIPCSVSYCYDEWDSSPPEYMAIEWRKWKGGKRICYVHHGYRVEDDGELIETENVTPYEEWSTEVRLDLLRHVPGLFVKAAKETEAFVNRIHGKEGIK